MNDYIQFPNGTVVPVYDINLSKGTYWFMCSDRIDITETGKFCELNSDELGIKCGMAIIGHSIPSQGKRSVYLNGMTLLSDDVLHGHDVYKSPIIPPHDEVIATVLVIR